MSGIEYAYRVDITGHAQDGGWDVLVWSLTNPETGNTHESACYWTAVPGHAKHVWRQLDGGQVPADLVGKLSGWRGLHISAVQQWRRFARPEGWGPWSLHVSAIEGTREIRTGSCAPGAADPRHDDALRQLLGLPPRPASEAAA